MAFSVTQRVISSEDMIYSYCDDFCRKAKLLYNAALFVSVTSLLDMKKNIGQTMKKMSFVRFMRYKMFILRSMSEKLSLTTIWRS